MHEGVQYNSQDNTLGRLDPNVLVQLWVREGQFDGLFHLLDLLLEATNIGVGLGGRFLDL